MGRAALEDLLCPLDPVADLLDDPAGGGAPTLLRSMAGWHVLVSLNAHASVAAGEAICSFAGRDGRSVTVAVVDGRVRSPFSFEEALTNLMTERWRETESPRALSASQLSLFYRVKRLIPRGAQLAGRRALIRWQGSPDFPAWPLDDSASGLLRLYGHCLCRARGNAELRFRWFWPRGQRAAAILTHDVESAAGLRNSIRIADIEEARGFRSSFNIVGSDYPIDHGIVAELRDRGFEIGVHGIHHDRSLFSSRGEFEAQLPQLKQKAAELQAVGFRSPATHRVIDWLPELPADYDCTVPHSDPYEPLPGGSTMVWPYFLGRIVELPYTMPQDHTLFTLLRQRTIDAWARQLERLRDRNGLIQLVTHPDPGYLGDFDNELRYVAFLDLLGETDGVWSALPREVSSWWRLRACGTAEDATVGVLRAGSVPEETELLPLDHLVGTG